MGLADQLIADGTNIGHMAGWEWGWMVTMMFAWVVFIGLIAWVVVTRTGRDSSRADPETTLAQRYARGEISAEEFAERRTVLRE